MKTFNTNIQPETATLDTWVEGKPFTIHGDYEAVAAQLPIADQYIATQPAVEAPISRPEPKVELGQVSYHEPALRAKINDWFSDLQWKRFDYKYGTTIVHERRAQRIAQRILVARIAAGVESPPVWGKHKAALKLAERALQ